jgi:hypothetical protein
MNVTTINASDGIPVPRTAFEVPEETQDDTNSGNPIVVQIGMSNVCAMNKRGTESNSSA